MLNLSAPETRITSQTIDFHSTYSRHMLAISRSLCTVVLGFSCLVAGCAFTSRGFVSYVDFEGIRTRDVHFRRVAVIDRTAELEIWPDCLREWFSKETMFPLVPIPPSIGEFDANRASIANEQFTLTIRTTRLRKVDIDQLAVWLETANGLEQLVFDSDDPRAANEYNPAYRFSSSAQCGDLQGARLRVEGLDQDGIEMVLTFKEERRTVVSYQWGFHT